MARCDGTIEQMRMVENLTLFQAHKQVFRKQFLKRKFGLHFPPFLSEHGNVV